jgi:hypothetical protein
MRRTEAVLVAGALERLILQRKQGKRRHSGFGRLQFFLILNVEFVP